MRLNFNPTLRKRFWIVVVAVSAIGAAFSSIMIWRKENLIESAREASICLGNESRTPTLGMISNSKELQQYKDYINGSTPFVKWKSGGSLVNGQKVKILDYSLDSTLIKVLVIRERNTIHYPSREEHWIHRKYVSKVPCSSHNERLPRKKWTDH